MRHYVNRLVGILTNVEILSSTVTKWWSIRLNHCSVEQIKSGNLKKTYPCVYKVHLTEETLTELLSTHLVKSCCKQEGSRWLGLFKLKIRKSEIQMAEERANNVPLLAEAAGRKFMESLFSYCISFCEMGHF